MKSVAIYLRVSTNKQELLMQVNAIEKWIKALPPEERPTKQRIFQDEGQSGVRDDRPGFQSMLAACRAGEVDTVIVYRLDRFTRSTYTALRIIMELDQMGVAFIATSQPVLNLGHGMPFRMTMLAAFAEIAEIERTTIVARIRAGLDARRAQGYKLGNPYLTDAKRNRILELWDEGMSKYRISRTLKCSRTTVIKVIKAAGAEFPPDPMDQDYEAFRS